MAMPRGLRWFARPRQATQAPLHLRWIRSIGEECLDHLLILHERHLQRLLQEFSAYFKQRRPHQGLAGRPPVPPPAGSGSRYGHIHRLDVLGGIIHDGYQVPNGRGLLLGR